MSKLTAFAGVTLLVGLTPPLLAGETAQTTPEIVETTVALSSDEASLELVLPGDRTLSIDFDEGRIYVNGSEMATYEVDGDLEGAWREFLREATEGGFDAAWSSFSGASFEDVDGTAASALIGAIVPWLSGEMAATVAPVAPERAALEPATAAAAPASQVEPGTAPREFVRGGLVVELSNTDGTARRLKRLLPGLPGELDQAFRAPLRIVIEADDYRLPDGAQLDRSLVLVETDGSVAGEVAGNVIVADGSLHIAPTARIEGDVVAIDAYVYNEGTVLGVVREIEDVGGLVVAPAPRIRVPQRGPSVLGNVWRGAGSLFQTLAAYVIFVFLGALVVYFFRGQLEVVSDTVSFSFGRSFLAGLAAEVLFCPILLVLAVLILTWIAIPFYVLGAGLALLLGYLAVAHAAGENLTRRRYPSWAARLRRANSYYYVVNGLAVLLALFAAAAAAQMGGPLLDWAHGLLTASAVILTWVAGTSGLGAVMLSRAGTRRNYARPHEIPELPVDPLAEHAFEFKSAEAPRRTSRQPEDQDEN